MITSRSCMLIPASDEIAKPTMNDSPGLCQNPLRAHDKTKVKINNDDTTNPDGSEVIRHRDSFQSIPYEQDCSRIRHHDSSAIITEEEGLQDADGINSIPYEAEEHDYRRRNDVGDIPYEDDDDMDYPDCDKTQHSFPTHPAFTVKVSIRSIQQLGENQYGVFAVEDIPPNTQFWTWTDRVVSYHYSELKEYLDQSFANDNVEGIRTFLRRGFILPSPDDDYFHSNPTDAGCFMNHSKTPNCGQPHGTLRLIRAGEELTMDYSQNGNPSWYVDLCHEYGILTSVEIAQRQKVLGNDHYTPADFEPCFESSNGKGDMNYGDELKEKNVGFTNEVDKTDDIAENLCSLS